MSVVQKIAPVRLSMLFVLLLASSPASSHFFLNVGGANVSIDDGSMDGLSALADQSGTAFTILPRQEDAVGLSIGMGSYWDDGSFSFNYVSSEHDGQWRGIRTESQFRSFALDLRTAVIGQGDLKGQVIFGVGMTSLNVTNGGVNSGVVGDAKYKGFDFRLGAGVRYRATDNVSLELNFVQRIGSYESVDGVTSGTIITDVDGDGLTTSLDLIYVFDD